MIKIRWMLPSHGDKRVIKRFLILPLKINDEARWLEFAMIEQYYHTEYLKRWRNERFINNQR